MYANPPQVLANGREDKQILLDCSYSRHIIVEFVTEPPVPNVYLGEEHIQSHLCSVRHKRTTLLSKGLPQASRFHRTYRTQRENHNSSICARYFLFLDRLLP